MHNVWLSEPTARVSAGTWQLSLLRGSSQVLKPGGKWVVGGTKFPTSLSFSCWCGQDTRPLKKPLCVKLWSLETADKEGLDGKVTLASLEKVWNQGEWACLCSFLAFPQEQAWSSFLVTVQPGPLFMRFGGQRSCMSQCSWYLASPALTCTPCRLPAPAHLPVCLVQLPGKLTADIPEGWESISLRQLSVRAACSGASCVGPLCNVCHAKREAIAGCAGAGPAISSRSETPSSFHSNILGHFQVSDWILVSSVLQLLFKQYLRLVFFLPISAGTSYL